MTIEIWLLAAACWLLQKWSDAGSWGLARANDPLPTRVMKTQSNSRATSPSLVCPLHHSRSIMWLTISTWLTRTRWRHRARYRCWRLSVRGRAGWSCPTSGCTASGSDRRQHQNVGYPSCSGRDFTASNTQIIRVTIFYVYFVYLCKTIFYPMWEEGYFCGWGSSWIV